MKVIAHCNRILKGAERRYFILEKEILAVVYCINKFRYYLVGKPFEVWSDNQALSFLLKCNLTNACMSRWIIAMQEYDFVIRYCKGSDNKIAGILRSGVRSTEPILMKSKYWLSNTKYRMR